jgi:hypothetical protein
VRAKAADAERVDLAPYATDAREVAVGKPLNKAEVHFSRV